MRILLPLALLATPATAEDFVLRAPVVAATLHADAALLTRAAEVDLPPGDHRLILVAPAFARPHDVTLPEGMTAGAPSVGPAEALDLKALDTPEEAEARAAVEAAEAGVEAIEARIADARAAVMAARTRLDWLATLTGGGEGGLAAPADPAALSETLDLLGTQAQAAAEARRAAEARIEALQEERGAAVEALEEARAALARLAPPDAWGNAATLTIPVQVASPVAGEVRLTDLGYGASWSPAYDLRLDTGTGALTLDRRVTVRQSGPETWRGVGMRFATTRVAAGTTPATPGTDVVRIGAPELVVEESFAADALAAPRANARVRVAAAPVAAPVFDGLSVTYAAPAPVTVAPGVEASVALAPLAPEVTLSNRAVPRRDATAFLMADAVNASPEPVLPGPALLFRDGSYLGETRLAAWAPGATAEIGFGPLDHLVLEWRRVTRGEGDAGVFVRSDTLREVLELSVENLSGAAEAVTVLHALPVSEQDDLEVEVAATPAPDVTDWDGRRGVAAWDMEVAPGAARTIRLEIEMDWPEGERLVWRP
ncbi:DUF4139 domain-containing protein [Jannaschia sp. Os4]|uniref:DUF4139 domain-containing protein n=1 Tax=Jannaschia sp. Os4 TaxID=2807617 RepID=UPI001939788F|nr:DUF4139 domain-containing protein [Jannaschia sp. Os4]MBM2575420.1 DUF4139 domain-containing protein [Jannaschia sp. Os4]